MKTNLATYMTEMLKVRELMRALTKPPVEPPGFESTPEGFVRAAKSAAPFFASLPE